MRIFVAGGTGVVGRRAVPVLVAQGHEVTALVRSADRADAARALGARPVEASLFDPASLSAVVAGHEVVVNLATSIPPFSKAARAGAWARNDRIRTDGARNLVNAALEAAVSRYVQESVTFLYADNSSAWIHEGHPLRPNSITASAVRAEEQARRILDRGSAVILRFGAFYGPDSGHTVSTLRLARMGLGSMPGPRDAFVSSIATDDAAAAWLWPQRPRCRRGPTTSWTTSPSPENVSMRYLRTPWAGTGCALGPTWSCGLPVTSSTTSLDRTVSPTRRCGTRVPGARGTAVCATVSRRSLRRYTKASTAGA